jgi:hypothetical protein
MIDPRQDSTDEKHSLDGIIVCKYAHKHRNFYSWSRLCSPARCWYYLDQGERDAMNINIQYKGLMARPDLYRESRATPRAF